MSPLVEITYHLKSQNLPIMRSLRELSQSYKNLYPEYPNPLAAFNQHDKKLENIKREALLPHLKNLEGQLVIYRNQMLPGYREMKAGDEGSDLSPLISI